MYKFDNILICLDLTEMDDFLISYANYIVDTFKPQKITFIHVMESFNLPEEMASDFPELDAPLQDIIREELEEKVKTGYNGDASVSPKLELLEGHTTEEIVNYARGNKITLTLMGKKIGYLGRGGVVLKILGLIPSSVLLISETAQRTMKRLMVRMDYSRISAIALKMAGTIVEQTNGSTQCLRVIKVPITYFPQQTKTAEVKLKTQLTQHAEKEYKKFMKRQKLSEEEFPCEYVVDFKSDEAQIIYNKAIQNDIDLLIIGSKIKSSMANVILDSTSEKLAGAEKNIPVLIVKDRKQSIGFLEALFD
ncbi:MAG: universal stress protein [Bacteroidales bacterium]